MADFGVKLLALKNLVPARSTLHYLAIVFLRTKAKYSEYILYRTTMNECACKVNKCRLD